MQQALVSRVSAQDGVILVATLCATVLLVYEYNFFEHADTMSAQDRRVTMRELFLASGLFIVSLVVFSFRRVQQSKRELGLRLAAEFEAHQARHQAMRDVLTGLPNRRALTSAVSVALNEPDLKGDSHALVLFDLNGFKSINDNYGHPVGDRVLQAIAGRLSDIADGTQIAARLGGDEFAIFCPSVERNADIERLIRAAVAEIEAPIVVDGVVHRVGAGAGIAYYPAHAKTQSELFRCADVALYRAKASNHSAVHSYS